VIKTVQGFVDEKTFKDNQPLAEGTVHLYDRQVKSFANAVFDE